MAGWRLGFAVGKPAFISNILKVKSNIDSGMFFPIQMGAISALKQSKDWFLALNKEYSNKSRKDFKKVSEKEGEVSITEGKAHIATKDLGIKLGESSEAVILSIVQRESGGKLRTFLVVENP